MYYSCCNEVEVNTLKWLSKSSCGYTQRSKALAYVSLGVLSSSGLSCAHGRCQND